MINRRFFLTTLSFFIALFVFYLRAEAQDLLNISYPIPELGNCGSQAECKAFCDNPANHLVCAEWAARNNIISEQELAEVKREVEQREKFERGEIPEGPGGCKTPEECDAYCALPEHAEECLKFAIEHNLITPEEAEQIQKEMEETKGPGGCKTNEECDAYCSMPEHIEECIEYAAKEGSLTREEADELLEIRAREIEMREKMPRPEEFQHRPKEPEIKEEKVIEILKVQKGPGGCSTPEECKEYCSDISHAEECLSFAEKNNLASPEELKEMRKMNEIMTTTGGPGGCKSPKECDEYCSIPEHQDECLKFAKEHNLLSPEEEKMIEKMGVGGPGGCRTPQECDAYCRDPQHMEECLMFSVEQGFMTEQDAQKMIEILKRQEERAQKLRGAPPAKGIGPESPPMFEQGMPKQGEWPEGEQRFGPGFRPEEVFPGGQMPPEGFQPPYEGQMPPEGMIPPQGMMPPEGHPEMIPPDERNGKIATTKRSFYCRTLRRI